MYHDLLKDDKLPIRNGFYIGHYINMPTEKAIVYYIKSLNKWYYVGGVTGHDDNFHFPARRSPEPDGWWDIDELNQ